MTNDIKTKEFTELGTRLVAPARNKKAYSISTKITTVEFKILREQEWPVSPQILTAFISKEKQYIKNMLNIYQKYCNGNS